MEGLKGIVFDMDDTLYLERDYVRSGFQAVATLVGESGTVPKNRVFAFLWDAFASGVRGNTFDLLLETFPMLCASHSAQDLIHAYREHVPTIGMSEEMHGLITSLQHDDTIALGVISDGPLVSQQAKVSALGLEKLFDEIVLTDRWGQDTWKPHHQGFDFMERRFNAPPENMAYIADNPSKDFIAPNDRGWQTIRLHLPGQLRFDLPCGQGHFRADLTADSIEELRNLLEH